MYNKTINKNTVDFDIHGIVGIRLVNPSEIDIKNISRQLSHFKSELIREPDITIVYREKWDIGDITYLGLNEVGFNDGGFYILSSGKHPLKVKIPFEQIGTKCEIICEQGVVGIPLLNRIINITFLKKKYLPIHASAFSYNNLNVLIIGWTKGGKSEALFSFVNHGARFIGDETIMLSADGKQMFGIPVPVSIWEWQFSEIPELMPPLKMKQKILFSGIHFLDGIYNLSKSIKLHNNSFVSLLGDALPTIKKKLNIRVAPEKIFNGKLNWEKVKLDKIVLTMSYSQDDIEISECDKYELINRMICSNLDEFDSLYKYYSAFKFAFPGTQNEFLESIPDIYYELLPKAITGIESYKVLHPYPVSYEKLYGAMKSIFETKIIAVN
jgi:hypothetical protein